MPCASRNAFSASREARLIQQGAEQAESVGRVVTAPAVPPGHRGTDPRMPRLRQVGLPGLPMARQTTTVLAARATTAVRAAAQGGVMYRPGHLGVQASRRTAVGPEPGQVLVQPTPLDQLEREVELAQVLAHLVDRDDPRVVELGDHLRLVAEAPGVAAVPRLLGGVQLRLQARVHLLAGQQPNVDTELLQGGLTT